MTLLAHEFIRRFLLPKGLMRIRHYGFLANLCRRRKLAVLRIEIGYYQVKHGSQGTNIGLDNVFDRRIDVSKMPNQIRTAGIYPAPALGLKTNPYIECTDRDYCTAQSNRHFPRMLRTAEKCLDVGHKGDNAQC